MSQSLVTMSYIAASGLFILSLSGLSHQKTARQGNYNGMIGMALAILSTVMSDMVTTYSLLIVALVIGGLIGARAASKVKMTQMPELVAIMHSLVGMSAVLVGYANFFENNVSLLGIEQTIHEIEIYIGILIGAITFSGSVIAFGKLCGYISSRPILLPGRYLINLALLIAVIILGYLFVSTPKFVGGAWPLFLMVLISIIFGIHMVLAIGGADMPIVVSMLNSYSGWAAVATGFMLSNDLLIVTGALVGSSGAILSYIMCKAMNRNFLSVISGGFGDHDSMGEVPQIKGDVISIQVNELVVMLRNATNIMIIPGYGMAVAQAQHAVYELSKQLTKQNKKVRFAIHPVAGRMPGHMNVLLAETNVDYDKLVEMEDINSEFQNTDAVLVVGANDVVNPAAHNDPASPIYGMPILDVENAKSIIINKRSMNPGYAGIENELFFNQKTSMLFGDAKDVLTKLVHELKNM